MFGKNGGGGRIKSIQAGEGTLSSDSRTATVNIDPVDPDKSVVLVTFRPRFQTNPALIAILLSASISSNGTSIYLERHNPGYVIDFHWQVIEFEGVKSLQKGTTLMTTASLDVTIDPVDISKSLLFFSNHYDVSGQSIVQETFLTGQIMNQTTLNFQQYASRSRTVKWQVIEFE